MKSPSALLLAVVLQTISTLQVPQKYRSRVFQKTPHWSELGGLGENQKGLVDPDLKLSCNAFTLPVC